MQTGAKALLGVAAAMLAAIVSCAHAAPTTAPAGSTVANIAHASFSLDGTTTSITSNVVTTRIDEILDVALTPELSGPVSVPPQGLASFGVPVTLTNHGNGAEAFAVKAGIAGQDGVLAVAIDVDGDGVYNPAVDTPIVWGGLSPVLAPGASIPLILHLTNTPVTPSTIAMTVSAGSGEGAPATLFPGAGDNGSDAIIGPSRATASLDIPLEPAISIASEPATLVKSQTVRAPDGSDMAQPGSVITYRLALTTSGTEPLVDAAIADAIPAGTTYVPASITIDGIAASDTRDNDAARFDGAAIHVAMGDINQPTTRVVTFQVTIQ
ncbi:MAG: hypothetical protein ABW192_07800 [Sphingobium sp.]